MGLKIGNLVIHPTLGLGDLVKIEEKQFSDEGMQLYYKITRSKHSMWIPVKAQESSGLRLVTPKSELAHYRHLLKSAPVPLKTNYQQRQLELGNRLRKGSFQAVCEVMRDLTASSWGKPLSQTDTTTLRKTRDALAEEWAAAAGVSIAEATKEITSLLLETRQTHFGLNYPA